jgi:putative ABC transport system ATP-binding protein
MLSPKNKMIRGFTAAIGDALSIKTRGKRRRTLSWGASCVANLKTLQLLKYPRGSILLCDCFCPICSRQGLAMTDNIILSVEHLTKFFKSGDQDLPVLSDVSFAVAESTACAIVGPSGSGKTTLIAMCAGLERPSAGTVFFDGIALHRSTEEELARVRNQSIGFIFQNFQLLPSLTALENVMVPAEIRGENHARGRAGELLQRVGLDHRLHHYPIQLSGGEQQRVAIARAFINRPKILFADEPTGNLDLETSKEIVRLIFELNATTGTTLVLVTHDPELTRQAGRVLSLRGGRLVADDEARGEAATQGR